MNQCMYYDSLIVTRGLICSFFPLFRSALSQHIKSVFVLLFQRLQSSKTTKFVKGNIIQDSAYIIFYATPVYPHNSSCSITFSGMQLGAMGALWVSMIPPLLTPPLKNLGYAPAFWFSVDSILSGFCPVSPFFVVVVVVDLFVIINFL